MAGFAWMTSVMRSHFERYHSVIFLDAMKKKTNMHLWPYMAVVIVNDLGESQPVCESIMMSEGNQSYKFLIQSALQMCVNVRSNDIKVVFGDEFFTKELIQTSGLTSAKLFYDHYHLQLNQEKYLGPYLFQKSKQMLQTLLNAASHERYLCIKKALIIKFQNEPKINCLLDKYSKIEHMILAYHIDTTPGSYMRRGSSPSEQNHSSIVSFIGDNFSGELNKLLMVLLERHCHKCTLTHQKLINHSNERIILIRDLITQYPDSEELKSAQYPNIKGHKLFIDIVSDSLNYIHTLDDKDNYLLYCVWHEQRPQKFASMC